MGIKSGSQEVIELTESAAKVDYEIFVCLSVCLLKVVVMGCLDLVVCTGIVVVSGLW